MDFEFAPEERAFAAEVERFLDEHATPDVADVTRENMAQIVDTPERRAFMKKLAARGWLGMTWPKEYGGQEKPGIYEYLLNEALARRGAPQIGKGVGIIGKTLIRHGSEKLKREFLPQIIGAEIEFAVGYSEPQAGSDAANMQLRATQGRRRLAAQRPEDLDHLGALRGLVLGRRAHRPRQAEARRHQPLPRADEPPGPRRSARCRRSATRSPTRSSSTTSTCRDDYLVGQRGSGFEYISEALDLERFTMFTFSPIEQRFERAGRLRARRDDATASRCASDPLVRQRIAQLATQREVARVLGLRFVAPPPSVGGKPPTVEASEYKLYATGLSQRVANAMMDVAGPGAQLRVHTEEAPLRGRAEMTYRYSVIDTIGGGASEIQKNIIARRKLGLPKNF